MVSSVGVACTRTLRPFMSATVLISRLEYMSRRPSVASAMTRAPCTVSDIIALTALDTSGSAIALIRCASERNRKCIDITPAYGAQIVHMPFGSVYTSLQTGVVDVAENGVNVYLANKHYEVAPVLSMTEHEANNSLVWVSDKLWNSLTPEQQGWVQAAADEVNKNQPAKAIELEHQSQDKLKSIGVKIVTDVDKSGFTAVADPYLDKLAKELGPHAEKIKNLIRAIK